MKKLLVLISLLAGCTFQSREERFVNPLFYKTLYPISNHEVETRLTPTKIYTESVIPEENCSLLKNTKNELIFSCEYDHPLGGHVSDRKYHYIITDKKYTQNCLVVELYRDEKQLIDYSAYCIHLDE